MPNVEPMQIAPVPTILYLTKVVVRSSKPLAISLMWDSPVVELLQVGEEAFIHRLRALPNALKRCPLSLTYHNGEPPRRGDN